MAGTFSEGDARALHAAQPKSRLAIIPAMNHVLKDVESDDRAVNLAIYANPDLPVDTAAVEAIAAFVKRR